VAVWRGSGIGWQWKNRILEVMPSIVSGENVKFGAKLSEIPEKLIYIYKKFQKCGSGNV
jgi:hypothetical protein